MSRDLDLPDELVECLETYCEGRCPEFAQTLLEELSLYSQRTEDAEQHCTYARLLRSWHCVVTKRHDLPKLPAPTQAPKLNVVPNGLLKLGATAARARNRPSASALQKWRAAGPRIATVRSLLKG